MDSVIFYKPMKRLGIFFNISERDCCNIEKSISKWRNTCEDPMSHYHASNITNTMWRDYSRMVKRNE